MHKQARVVQASGTRLWLQSPCGHWTPVTEYRTPVPPCACLASPAGGSQDLPAASDTVFWFTSRFVRDLRGEQSVPVHCREKWPALAAIDAAMGAGASGPGPWRTMRAPETGAPVSSTILPEMETWAKAANEHQAIAAIASGLERNFTALSAGSQTKRLLFRIHQSWRADGGSVRKGVPLAEGTPAPHNAGGAGARTFGVRK